MPQSKTFGRLLRMAVNGIAAYEGKNAPLIEDELGQQIGLSAAAIQRYKAGHLPPEPRTIGILAEAAVRRGHLDRRWLGEFLDAAAHPAPDALLDQLFPSPLAPPAPLAPPVAPPDRNRARMLEKVRSFWVRGVLEQSLHGAVLIELGLVDTPAAVERPWDAVVQQPARPPRPLPPGTPVRQVFDELGGALLILGAPGAGKTTMLLELARDLIARAEADPSAPMPVVLNLSTWDGRHQSLDGWLADELQLRYQAPRRLALRWVAGGQILPLLDGLDELAAERRAACVAAINRFHEEHGLHGLAVASRLADYELLSARLRLHGAVCIQPLSRAQVERYLDAAGPALAGLRAALAADAGLRELAETPLMLSIMSLACRGERHAALERPASLAERRGQIFELYVGQMFARRSAAAPYPAQQVRRSLGWLALQMQRRNQSVFALEGLQPAWLPSPSARLRFGVWAGALMGVVACLMVLVGLAATIGVAAPLSADTGQASWTEAVLGLGSMALCAAGVGVGALARGRRTVVAAVVLAALGCALALISLSALPVRLGPLWFAALPIAGLLGAAVGLVGGLVRLARGRDRGDDTVRVVETLHWSPRRALRWFAEASLAGQLITLLAVLPLNPGGSPFNLLALLVALLIGGLACGVIGGLAGGLVGGEVERRTTPNQGIHQSARHTLRAIMAGPLVALSLVPILGGGSLLISLITDPDNLFMSLSAGATSPFALPLLLLVLISTPLIGAMIGLVSGGVACLQHTVLRLMLCRARAMPIDYVRLLDHAAERLLLRKVGGSYIFVHRLLLEHIAATDGAAWAARVTAPGSAGLPTTRLTGRHLPIPAPLAERLAGWRGRGEGRSLRERAVTLAGGLSTAALLVAALGLAAYCYGPNPRLAATLGGPRSLSDVGFADGGSAVVAASNRDATLLRWPVGAGEPQLIVHPRPDNFYRYGGAVAPGGDLLAFFVNGNTVELRRASDAMLLRKLPGQLGAFSPDGELLATVLGRGDVRIWHVASGGELGRLSAEHGYVQVLAFSHDGATLATAGYGGEVQLWRVADQAPLLRFAAAADTAPRRPGRPINYFYPPVATALDFAPDGRALAVALSDGSIELRSPADGGLLRVLAGHDDYVHALAFAPDGRTLASGSRDRSVRLWRTEDGAALDMLRGHLASVTGLAFAPDGRSLASASIDRSVRLWRVDSGG